MQEEDLCQAFSDVLLNNVEDIDAEDWENPQLCSDYVKDIYLYLRELEVGFPRAVLAGQGGCVALTPCPHCPRVPTAAAGGAAALPGRQGDQRPHARHPGGLAGPGALEVPPPAGDALHVCGHHGSLPAGLCTLIIQLTVLVKEFRIFKNLTIYKICSVYKSCYGAAT